MVTLHVTGDSHTIGDLCPGASKEVIVKPTGESELEIEFIDERGNAKLLNAGGYFEPGYRGTIVLAVKDGAIVANDQQVSIY